MTEEAKIRRINVFYNRIRFILCRNDQTRANMADDDGNNDEVIAVASNRSINSKIVEKEMVLLTDMIRDMTNLVDTLLADTPEGFAAKQNFRDAITRFEMARKDVLDSVQERMAEKNPVQEKVPVTGDTTLVILEGGVNVSEWA